MRVLCVILFLLLNQSLWSQFNYVRSTKLNVFDKTNTKIQLALAGGFNSPQFSNIDLNFDGTPDLLIFDRTSNCIKTFVWLNSQWNYYPEAENYFPTGENMMLCRDYNCDGKSDIITHRNTGFAVFQNISDSILKFKRVKGFKDIGAVDDKVSAFFGKYYASIYAATTDIIAWEDIDGDSDLDILSFDQFGSKVQHYKNLSIEKNGNCDSLLYRLVDNCWGNFSESSNSNKISLNINCGLPPQANSGKRHAGGTLTAIDIDSDNDKDLLIGDITYSNIWLLNNGGDSNSAYINSYDTTFPAGNGANVYLFPAAYNADVNNDGINDIIISPNSSVETSNIQNAWVYSKDATPNYQYKYNNFLTQNMIHVGGYASPSFGNINGDNLPDLVIGNSFKKSSVINKNAGVSYFMNSSSDTSSSFTLVTNNLDSLQNLNLKHIVIRYADLNNDGLNDKIIGDQNGNILFFKARGNYGKITSWQNWNISSSPIDVGYNASPELFDINHDGLLDLIYGERLGIIGCIINSGSVSMPYYNLNDKIDTLGGIVLQSIYKEGYTSPRLLKINSEGKTYSTLPNSTTHLLVGTSLKHIYIYKQKTGANYFEFIPADTLYYNNSRLSITTNDLNNDSIHEIFVGESGGGIGMLINPMSKPYKTNQIQNHSSNNQTSLIYPNPVIDKVMLRMDINKSYKLTLINSNGEILRHQDCHGSKNCEIDLSQEPNGLYLIQVTANKISETFKIVKTN